MLNVVELYNQAQASQSCWPLHPISLSKHPHSQTHTHVSFFVFFFRNVLLWVCRLGFSQVCAFPQFITWYSISVKWLVYFGDFATLHKCLWKKEKLHFGFVFTLSETTFGSLWTTIKSPRLHCHKPEIHVLIMFLVFVFFLSIGKQIKAQSRTPWQECCLLYHGI